jgi:hypothetical protein
MPLKRSKRAWVNTQLATQRMSKPSISMLVRTLVPNGSHGRMKFQQIDRRHKKSTRISSRCIHLPHVRVHDGRDSSDQGRKMSMSPLRLANGLSCIVMSRQFFHLLRNAKCHCRSTRVRVSTRVWRTRNANIAGGRLC